MCTLDFHVDVSCNTNASDVCEIAFTYLLTYLLTTKVHQALLYFFNVLHPKIFNKNRKLRHVSLRSGPVSCAWCTTWQRPCWGSAGTCFRCSCEFYTILLEMITRNSSGDEIANVNFLCDDIVHALENKIDSCINSATDSAADGQRTKWRRNIAENFNRIRLSRVHERYRQTDDRRQTDGRRHIENVNVSLRSLIKLTTELWDFLI